MHTHTRLHIIVSLYWSVYTRVMVMAKLDHMKGTEARQVCVGVCVGMCVCGCVCVAAGNIAAADAVLWRCNCDTEYLNSLRLTSTFRVCYEGNVLSRNTIITTPISRSTISQRYNIYHSAPCIQHRKRRHNS